MGNNQPENHNLYLTNFTKDLFSDKVEYDLNKDPNSESFFEPIPNQFYGFCIPIHVFNDYVQGHDIGVNTIDVDYEDVTIKKIA